MSENLEIDPDFEAALRPLTIEELAQLENNILKVGKIIDPIVAWGNKIIDGINRYRIAEKHGLPFDVVRLDFDDKDDVVKWMHRNQVGRRNLAGIGLIKTRAAIAAALEEEDGQSLVAESLNISPRTLRDNKRTSAILQTIPKDIESQLTSGEIAATTKDLRALAEIPIESRAPIYADWQSLGSLKEALTCNRSGLSSEDLAHLLDKLHQFAPVINKIRSGAIKVTKFDVDRFMGFPEPTQQLVGCILMDEPKSLKDAMDAILGTDTITKKDRAKKSANEAEKSMALLINKLKMHSQLSGKCCEAVVAEIQKIVSGWLWKGVAP